MRSRVAEIGEHAIAHVPGDKAIEFFDHFSDGTVICGHDLPQILGIEPRRECGRADCVEKHNGQLTPSGNIGDLLGCCRGFQSAITAQSGNRSEQFAAMSDHADTDVPEIVGGQFRQHRGIDLVFTKRRLVLLQPEITEPLPHVHVVLPLSSAARSSVSVISSQLTPIQRRGTQDKGPTIARACPRLVYSGLMLAARIIWLHLSVSFASSSPSSFGVNGRGTLPRSAIRALIFGSARPALISQLSVSTISSGVPLGAPTPFQVLAS